MAKDPAFLFYPNDWSGGTMILNRHQKGCYLDLLIAQFNNGPLSLESIKTLLGQDQAVWTVLSSKFKQDSAGNYFNERLAAEVEKRRAFSEKQKINGMKGGRKPNPNPTLNPNTNPNGSLLENGNRNENEVGNETLKGGSGGNRKQEFLTNQKWKEEFCMAKSLQMHELEKMMQDFVSDCDLKGEYIDSYKKYFTNLFNKNANGKAHQRTIPGGTTKPTRGETTIKAYKEWGLGSSS